MLIGVYGNYYDIGTHNWEQDYHMMACLRCEASSRDLPLLLSEKAQANPQLDKSLMPYWIYDLGEFSSNEKESFFKVGYAIPNTLRLVGRAKVLELIKMYSNPGTLKSGGINPDRKPVMIKTFTA